MTAQEKARARNWNKYRIVGGNVLSGVDPSILTLQEVSIIAKIRELRNILLDNWDVNTEIVLGHSLPPYRCCICNKRGNNQYTVNGQNYCFKHGKEFRGY